MPNDAQPSTSGSSNKMWYIIGGIVLLIILVWFAAKGAGFFALRAAGVDVTPSANGSVTYTGNEGSVTVGATMPSNWPSDAPGIYSGGSIQYSGTSNPQTGKSGSAVVYSVSAPIASVVDYYKAELAKGGWNVEGTAQTGGATVISAKKDTRTMGVYVVDSGNGLVSVTAGIEM